MIGERGQPVSWNRPDPERRGYRGEWYTHRQAQGEIAAEPSRDVPPVPLRQPPVGSRYSQEWEHPP